MRSFIKIIRGYSTLICFAVLFCNFHNGLAQREKGNVTTIEGLNLSGEKRLNSGYRDTIEFKELFSDGLLNKSHGDIDAALECFNRCIEIAPHSYATMFELAKIYSIKNEIDAAYNYANQAVLSDSANIWYKLLLAEIFQKQNKFVDAQAIYEEIILKFPKRYDYQEILLDLYLLGKNYDKAINLLNQIEANIGINANFYIQRERIYALSGDYKKALKEIETLIELYPDEIMYYGMLAESYFENGDKKNALKTYKEILKKDPDNGVVHLSLYEYYRKNGKYEKAKNELLLAFNNKNIRVEQKIDIVNNLNGLNNTTNDTFIDELSKVLMKAYPDELKAFPIYTNLLIKEGKNREARDMLRKYVDVEKSNFIAWQQLILFENDFQDFKIMYNESIEALEYFPNQPLFYLLKGISANQLQLYDESLEALQKGSKISTNNTELVKQFYIALGEVHNNLKNHKKSDTFFDMLLSLESDNVQVLNNYSYYLAIRKTKLGKAETMIKNCIELEPQNPTFMDTYAWVLFQQGNYDKALKIIEDVIRIGEDISDVELEHYGDILYMLERKEDAVVQWKKAIKLGEGSGKLNEKINKGLIINEQS
ncbi:tetratricopeptide repeat protein [Bacteroidota bacterium]